jgi:phosphoribosylformylglycinamidine synthase
MPVAHGEGRFTCDDDVLKQLQDEDRIAFRYVPFNELDTYYNVNGSVDDIAGVLNDKGNVIGMMPHPERATRKILGSDDGLTILKALTLVRV